MRQKLQAALLAAVMGMVSIPHVVAADFTETTTPASLKTWIGYQLRDENGQYLTVANGVEENGVTISSYEADGVAAYNTWYFDDKSDGYYMIKSALGEGTSYLTVNETTMYLSPMSGETEQILYCTEISANEMRLEKDGVNFGTYTLEPVTWLQAGDVNRDGQVNIIDLTLTKQLVLNGSGTDFCAPALADVNGDGTLDTQDVAELQAYLLQERTDLSAETVNLPENTIFPKEETTATETITLEDMPEAYQYAADWIWQNRVLTEQSTARWNTLFDQIIAGDGELHYVVRWQSYKTVTLEQRQQFETMAEECVNAWTDWLKGYEDWPYDHITVKIVGWAVLDRSCLLDLQEDEVVYDNLISDYDSSGDTSNGVETIPTLLPSAPDENSRMEHFADADYVYPGERFDMYLWATQGFPSIGGCGGDWGQRLSDDAYLNLLSGENLHVLQHELGHGFGITDFYGEEGASDGFPPGGFPGDGTSIMMAGSSTEITDFDGWLLRYFWSQIHEESGRFDLS